MKQKDIKPKETGLLLDIADFRVYSDTYVETGTCMGGSADRAIKAGYKSIFTVEAWKPFYDHCKEHFKSCDIITLLFGKSTDRLTEMLTEANERAVIFLDAHPSGPKTAGHDELMNGDIESTQDWILTKELEQILLHRKDHIIIIDDQNGNNKENKKYIKTILSANPNYRFFFYDEQAGPNFYKNKALICIPDDNIV
jgi:hypothetical protein